MSWVHWRAGRECKYQGKKGYRWHKGVLGAPRGCRRHYRGVRGCRGCQGLLGLAGSIVLRGHKGYRWHKGALGAPRGCRGHQGAIRGVRGAGYQGYIWDVRGVLGAAGSVGTQNPERYRWHKGALGS